MDTDAFQAAHEGQWRRLRQLTRKRSLTGAEIDELAAAYRTTAAHLSQIRTHAPDPDLVSRLSAMVGEARGRLAGSHQLTWTDVSRFFLVTIPVSLYRARWWIAGSGFIFLVIAISAAAAFLDSPAIQASVGTPEELRAYAEEAFERYYSRHPAPDFAAQVWTNNAWIAFQSVGAGITGIWPAKVLWDNALAVGQAGGIMALHGQLEVFFRMILPHGMLELTCVIAAIGLGLKLFWTALVPGPRRRLVALREEGRLLIASSLGLVAFLSLAGILEAFVTPSPLENNVKIALGAVATALFWIYLIWLGRAASRRGDSGDLAEADAGYAVAEAA